MPNEPARTADKWQAFGHVELHPADAVECGWTRELAEQTFARVFAARATITAAEARAALDAARANGDGAARARTATAAGGAADQLAFAARLAEEILDYRIERARVAAEHQAIRHAKVNLKRMLKSDDVSVEQLRALAGDLGWAVREDEEGLTVSVNDLLPYFRRPVVRQLLDAKLAQCGRARQPRESV